MFTRVSVSGTLRGPAGLYGAEVRGGRLGAQLVELLDRGRAPPVVVVLGWVDTTGGMPRPAEGPAAITGYIRLPEQATWLSAADDVEGRRFYTLNPAIIGPGLGAPAAAPFTLVALHGVAGPIPADALPRPVNNHLQYALTWFGLAGALLAVFVSWASRTHPPKTATTE